MVLNNSRCPIRSGPDYCMSDCAFRDGENCLIAEALKNYNRLNSPLMSFYIDKKGGEPNPKETE